MCGIAYEICPLMRTGSCPNGPGGCIPKENRFCRIASCAFERDKTHCFECENFSCELTGEGAINLDFCCFISGRQAQEQGRMISQSPTSSRE